MIGEREAGLETHRVRLGGAAGPVLATMLFIALPLAALTMARLFVTRL